MAWITTALAQMWSIVTSCVTFIIGDGTENNPGQPLLQLFLVAGLIAVGFRIFRSAKKAARK